VPFITYNGVDICDSDFIIEYLSKKLNIDLSNRFSSSDLGVARAFSKMTEESLFWYILNTYSIFYKGNYKVLIGFIKGDGFA
jgi:hypothetical protein